MCVRNTCMLTRLTWVLAVWGNAGGRIVAFSILVTVLYRVGRTWPGWKENPDYRLHWKESPHWLAWMINKRVKKKKGIKKLRRFLCRRVCVSAGQLNVTVKTYFIVGGRRSWPLQPHSVCGHESNWCQKKPRRCWPRAMIYSGCLPGLRGTASS